MHNKKVVASLVAMLLTTFSFNAQAADVSTVECVKPTKEQIAGLFDRWNVSLQTLNPDAVLENYDATAVLLPTLSNQMRVTPEELREYFVHFLESKPVGRINDRFIKVGCGNAVDTGLYTFTLQDKNGKTHDVRARYTFVYKKVGDKWLIESHHSSGLPNPKKK